MPSEGFTGLLGSDLKKFFSVDSSKCYNIFDSCYNIIPDFGGCLLVKYLMIN